LQAQDAILVIAFVVAVLNAGRTRFELEGDGGRVSFPVLEGVETPLAWQNDILSPTSVGYASTAPQECAAQQNMASPC
jgi:hypothetical protein